MIQTSLQFLKENKILPDANSHIYMINGEDNTIIEIRKNLSINSIKTLSLNNITSSDIEAIPATDITFKREVLTPSFSAQALSCSQTSSNPAEQSKEPYYKNTVTGATGFEFTIALPTTSNAVIYDTGVPHIYGGFLRNSTSLEAGLQYLAPTAVRGYSWQPYIRINSLGYGPNTNGAWSGTWLGSSAHFTPGTPAYVKTNTTIGSDGIHYIVSQINGSGGNYYYGYRDNGIQKTISNLRPEYASSIIARKVIGIAYNNPDKYLAKGASIINASITGSYYINSQGQNTIWQRNYCVNTPAGYTVTSNDSVPSNQDLVTVQ